MRFLCDRMCLELGRWLRIAGYDVEFAEPLEKDSDLLERARLQGRLLLTRDLSFSREQKGRGVLVYLRGEEIEAWALQLRDEVGVEWLLDPFSRCLECNSPLVEIDRSEGLKRGGPVHGERFWLCPTSDHLFWQGSHTEQMMSRLTAWQNESVLCLGLGGDLMIGRGVSDHLNHQPYSYVWGDIKQVLEKTDFNLVNLECALTHSSRKVSKVFNFKAEPHKVGVLTSGPIHAVNLANNHILDFSEEGLVETLETLDRHSISHVGAGRNLSEAKEPLILEKKGIRLGIIGCTDNEPDWIATNSKPGTYFIEIGDVHALRATIEPLRRQVDLLILSIHWGPNMRERPSDQFRAFAHALIDLGVDILHGHSAHLFQGVEVYKNRVILYDTGDLVDDYVVDPHLRNDRSFFFLFKVVRGRIISLEMVPTQICHYQVNLSRAKDQLERMKTLSRELKSYPEEREGSLWLYLD